MQQKLVSESKDGSKYHAQKEEKEHDRTIGQQQAFYHTRNSSRKSRREKMWQRKHEEIMTQGICHV